MNIEFTGQYRWGSDGWLSFRGLVDGKSVTNRVATAALRDHFQSEGGRESDEAAYTYGFDTIQDLAREMIAAGRKNTFGGADITTDSLRIYLDAQED
jgi:hypothetical protein